MELIVRTYSPYFCLHEFKLWVELVLICFLPLIESNLDLLKSFFLYLGIFEWHFLQFQSQLINSLLGLLLRQRGKHWEVNTLKDLPLLFALVIEFLLADPHTKFDESGFWNEPLFLGLSSGQKFCYFWVNIVWKIVLQLLHFLNRILLNFTKLWALIVELLLVLILELNVDLRVALETLALKIILLRLIRRLGALVRMLLALIPS